VAWWHTKVPYHTEGRKMVLQIAFYSRSGRRSSGVLVTPLESYQIYMTKHPKFVPGAISCPVDIFCRANAGQSDVFVN